MAVYSQQPIMSWAPCCHGVCPHWWRPRRTARKLSQAPCAASIFLTLWVFDDQQGQTMEASNQGGYSLPRTFDSTVKGA